MITPSHVEAFERDGYVKVPQLFTAAERAPVLEGLERLLALKGATGGDLQQRIVSLARRDRSALARVYDGARKLQSFWSLVGSPKLAQAAQTLLGTHALGIAFRGAGIRLDLPHEDRWRSQWHQEYHSQMSSPRGVVAWFSLVPVTFDMGPVRIAKGSQREGLLPVECADPMNSGKDYTQTFHIPQVERLVERYPITSHETEAGDVVFIDFLTVHQSGWNRSDGRSRVTAQVRFFDMAEPTAVENHWVGGWQEGGDFTKIHPDKVVRALPRAGPSAAPAEHALGKR